MIYEYEAAEPSPADEAAYYQEEREQDALWLELGERAFFPFVYGDEDMQ